MSITGVVDSIASFLGSTKKFFTKIGQKLGLGAVAGTIQNGISIAVIASSIAFFGFVIYFITNMYAQFRNFLTYLSNLPDGGQWGSCFLNLMNMTGISAGVSMAMPFLMTVFVFYFGYAVYQITHKVLKTFSDETFKTSEAYK
ncbi:MAG: hypothetical protein J0647_09830 [Campylobacteraceae bacterium]|nr:hypothetical protein [Campylobacteraceae bacterium]